MQHLGFSLCSRCKKCSSDCRTVMVGNKLCGFICDECVSPMAELVEVELNRVAIPEALLPYLQLSAK
jgi:hypothetical protein